MEHYRLNIDTNEEYLMINNLKYSWDSITNIECNVVYNGDLLSPLVEVGASYSKNLSIPD